MQEFGIRNSTGATWPAFAMGRLGAVVVRDGVNSDLPLYTLIKPDGAAGIYVVNGPASLPTGQDGSAVHYLDAKYVAVDASDASDIGAGIGAQKGQWTAWIGGAEFEVTDVKNAQNVIAVTAKITKHLRVAVIGSLTAPTSATGTPTTCPCAVLSRNPTTGVLSATAGRVTITNYSPGLTAVDGTYALAEDKGGCWELYWVDCGASTGLTGLSP